MVLFRNKDKRPVVGTLAQRTDIEAVARLQGFVAITTPPDTTPSKIPIEEVAAVVVQDGDKPWVTYIEPPQDLLIFNTGKAPLRGTLIGREDPVGAITNSNAVVFNTTDSAGAPLTTTANVADLAYVVVSTAAGPHVLDVAAIQAQSAATRTHIASLAIGANLDFLNGIQATDAYYALRVMLPDAIFPEDMPGRLPDGWREKCASLRILDDVLRLVVPTGASVSMEQARLVTAPGDGDTAVAFLQTGNPAPDSVRGYKSVYSDKVDATTLSVGVYWRIFHSSTASGVFTTSEGAQGRARAPGVADVRSWLVFLGEFRHTRLLDTWFREFPKDTIPRHTDAYDFRKPIYSCGIAGRADLSVVSLTMTGTLRRVNNRLRWYLVQTEIREPKYGIAIIGSVRDISNADPDEFPIASQSPSPGVKSPQYQVSISKVFALDRLLDFLVKG